MAKLDLTALKKQNTANEIPPASFSPSPQAESVAKENAADTNTAPPVVEIASAKTDAPASKAKISLLTVKKPWVSSAWAVSTSDASVESTAESVTEATTEFSSAGVTENVTKTSITPEKNDAITALSTGSTTTLLHISQDHDYEKPSSEGGISDASLHANDTSKAHSKSFSSEFFPNLGFENNELFSDIMEMGSLTETKAEKVEKNDQESLVVAELEVSSKSLEQAHNPVASNVSAETLIVDTSSQWVDHQPLPPEASNPSAELPMVVSQSEPVISEIVSDAQVPGIASDASEPISASTSHEPVESVENNISRDRKGGLATLFENKKKAIYGVSAMLSLGVVALMFWLGVFGKVDVTKSSVMESSPTVAKNTEEAPKEATMPVSGIENSADTTQSGVTDTTTPSVIQTDVTTVAFSGVTAIAVASESVTQTGITASGWVQTSINTYRAPNISTKRIKQ